MSGLLGRLTPPDWKHVERFPLAAAPASATPGSPVVLGINWYTAFDRPTKQADGRWWITSSSTLGTVRGGHAICAKPGTRTDTTAWWRFYDQGSEGACVGFSESRMMSLYNRTRYRGQWLYQQAQATDGWPLPHEGTSVRAGLEVLRTIGHERATETAPRAGDGITASRGMTTVDEIHQVLAMPLADRLGAIPLLNSWGTYYPHIAWMPDAVVARLLDEDGEAAVATDR